MFIINKKRDGAVEIFDLSKAYRIVVTKKLMLLEMESGKSYVVHFFENLDNELTDGQIEAFVALLTGKGGHIYVNDLVVE